MSMIDNMFSDARTGTERAERLEALKEALNASIERRDAKRDGFVHHSAYRGSADVGPIGIVKGAGSDGRVRRERMEKMAGQFESVAKSMTAAEQAEVNAALAELREMSADYLGKDITSTSPGDLHPYDLEPSAKHLVPRFRLLGNELPRTKGVGTAREYRRILGYTNTGTGGVPDMMPFFNSESDTGAPVFGQLPLRRGPKISYAMDVHTLVYQEMSVSDEVTSKAQFVNLGFENSRALSQMALLWAHMLGEEKALLYARGSAANGFEGAVAAPVAACSGASASGGSLASNTYYVKVTARAGGGESVTSGEVNSTAITGPNGSFIVTVTTEPVGALGYNLYIGTTTGTETFQTSFVGNSFTVTSYATGGAATPGADSTANANGYDGFLSVLADPSQAGYVNRVNAPLYTLGSTTNLGDKPFQDACAALFASVYADPDEVWLNAVQRRELADWTRSDTTGASSYRIELREGDNGMTVGGMVSGIMNESSPTDKIMDLRVHPYMPSGCSFIRSRTLDVPNSGIGDTTEIIEVQGYMSVDWPQIQYTWDSSTYWFGAPAHYAPKWSACLLGLQ